MLSARRWPAAGRYYLSLKAENGFLPDFRGIKDFILEKTRLLWINYPNNPTGAVAGLDFFNRVVEFAKKHNILVCHDGPYTEVSYDGYQPPSLLQAEGAKDVGIEFHSFSKSYNMTGWRIGMAVGNATAIGALKTFKSNLDSGIPQAIQQHGHRRLERTAKLHSPNITPFTSGAVTLSAKS